MTQKEKYPDVSELFRRREEQRRELARESAARKMEIAAKLRDANELLATARAANKARRAAKKR